MALDPGRGLSWVERAHAYLETGQYGLAMADAVRAIELRPPQFLGAAHVMHGRAHLGKGAVDAAIAEFTRAIEVQPSASAYAFRAVAYKQKGDKRRALADLSDARQYAPEGGAARRWVEGEVEKVEAMPEQ